MSETLAPIAVFLYKRPAHAAAVLKSLQNCRLSEKSFLRIYCDGPKSVADQPAVDEVRRIARSEKWCGQVEIVERSENWGLSKSIRTGVGELCDRFGKVVVVEDDLDLHPSFLEYMNRGLTAYADEPRVMQISGYAFPFAAENEEDAYFLPMGSCWGWGTWDRAWKLLDSSDRLYRKLKSDSILRKKFDWDGAYAYFDMLEKQLAGNLDSWGIFWHQTVFEHDGLVLMPNETLVCNRGADGSGTHVALDGHQDRMGQMEVRKFPNKIAESSVMRERMRKYLGGRRRWPFLPNASREILRAALHWVGGGPRK